MTVLPDDTIDEAVAQTEDQPVGLAELIDEKARELLDMTGQEFTRAWYAGQFLDDSRPSVIAMDRLMRTGRWE
jgi:hypothetical protein